MLANTFWCVYGSKGGDSQKAKHLNQEGGGEGLTIKHLGVNALLNP